MMNFGLPGHAPGRNRPAAMLLGGVGRLHSWCRWFGVPLAALLVAAMATNAGATGAGVAAADGTYSCTLAFRFAINRIEIKDATVRSLRASNGRRYPIELADSGAITWQGVLNLFGPVGPVAAAWLVEPDSNRYGVTFLVGNSKGDLKSVHCTAI